MHDLSTIISPNLILIIHPIHFHRGDELYVSIAYVPEYVHRKRMSLFNTVMKPILYEQICIRKVQKKVSTLITI
jgi:hypothetical protein